MHKNALVLFVALIVCSLLLAGCSQLDELLGKKKVVQNTTIPEEPAWQPDKSKPFKIQGIVEDSESHLPIPGVAISATYTINCPTKACKPFTETITTQSDANGNFLLTLYQQFWTVSFRKTAYNPTSLYYSKEQSEEENITDLIVPIKKGEYRNFEGTVRDQGKRIVVDRSPGQYITNINGKQMAFNYLVVVNEKDDPIYKELLINNNNKINFEGYVFISEMKEGEIQITTFTKE